MSGDLLSLLRMEGRQLLAELRATPIFQKPEAVRRVLGLYGGAGGGDGAEAEDLLPPGRAEAPPETHPVPPQRERAFPLRAGTAANAEGPGDIPVGAAPPSPPRGPAREIVAPAPSLPHTAAAPAPGDAAPAGPAPPRLAMMEAAIASPAAVRDGSRAVSAVRAALLAVTR
ncbi:hypothetical protein [Caldovatus aquaticus]|uniref:Uncharacterized protein n=1 Tax=Caldovatus aquaticus TaxID=2865671 RepID=A0ABS7EYD0_9PROT|nr:hypothetical protein [Caldovatus aquaticus]MBW8268368.1 hypothetical protein [Caldovatus aquaticus]